MAINITASRLRNTKRGTESSRYEVILGFGETKKSPAVY